MNYLTHYQVLWMLISVGVIILVAINKYWKWWCSSYGHRLFSRHFDYTSPTTLLLAKYVTLYLRAFSLIRSSGRLMLHLNIVGNILLGLAMLAEPILFGKVIDRISDAVAMNGQTNSKLSIFNDLLPLLIAWASFSVFCITVGSAISLHADCLAHNNQWLAAKKFYKHALLTGVVNILSKSPSPNQKGSSSGGLKTVMSEGVGALFWNWLSIMRSDLSSLVCFIVLLPLSLYTNLYMGMCLLVLTVVLVFVANYVVNKAHGMQHETHEAYVASHELTADVFSHLPLLQCYDHLDREVRLYEECSDKVLRAQLPVLNYWAIESTFSSSATKINTMVIIIVGAWLLQNNLISLGEIVQYLSFSMIVVTHLRTLVNALRRMTLDAPKLERFFDFLDTSPSVADRPDSASVDIVRGSVEFRHVTFRYDCDPSRSRPPAVSDLSFRVEAGQTVAIVGSSGSGECTVNVLNIFSDVIS